MREKVKVRDGRLDVEIVSGGDGPAVCLVHPYASMHTVISAVAAITGRTVVSVSPRGVAPSSWASRCRRPLRDRTLSAGRPGGRPATDASTVGIRERAVIADQLRL
jgi:hypothetical protein